MTRRTPNLAPVAALALLAAAWACGPREKTTDEPAAVAGLQEEMRTPPSVEFGAINAMTVDSRGRIFVGDGAQIVVLRPDGSVQARMGREGFGPGEFKWINTLAVLPRDSLYVYDSGLRRVTVYAAGGERPAYTTTLPGPEAVTPVTAKPAGGGIVAAYQTALGDVPGREQGGRLPVILRLLNTDASIRSDSLVLLREPQALRIYNGEGRGHLFYPFARRSLFAVSPAGTVYEAWTDSLRFTAHALDGRTRWTVSEPFKPRPVTRHEMDSVVNALTGAPFSAQTVRRALRATGTQTWPALRSFLVDDRERLWVSLTPAREQRDVEWRVLTRRGRAGTLRLPESVQLLAVRGERAYAIAHDEDDVQSVVVYRIQPGPAGKEAR
ncbi:MAG TPA: hypothetical protein VF665_09925 [Longimicrobium sp.]|jgi:hypothetical protein|uniref:hypothetical protein n=1 Tax=Longimicrobium sp. TaxID=2029185 RepID=UPI002EDA5E8C